MNKAASLSPEDLEQLSQMGISSDEIRRQLELLRDPPEPARLIRPCLLEDGIAKLSEAQQQSYVQRWRSLTESRRLAKFVPASGAATRMFKDLIPGSDRIDTVGAEARGELLAALQRFAFYPALESSFAGDGPTLTSLIERGDIDSIVQRLLGPEGLGYRTAPKGLILFHRESGAVRTAMEEQLREGWGYLSRTGGEAHVHFTVIAAHESAFRDQLARVREAIERQSGARLAVTLSNQGRDTDTIAVDLDNRLVRKANGRLLLRPAGHGALLKNLQEVDAELVFIKNIDNVSHRRLQPLSVHWKRVLAGVFAEIQEMVFVALSELDRRPDSPDAVGRALEILQQSFALQIPPAIFDSPLEVRSRYATDRLDRPLRVCGVVLSQGEPGGGPFWLPDGSGGASGQIVEAAQVDLASAEQTEIWNASTHFNPVDLVCGLQDWRGRRFRLDRFLDPGTSFVTRKTHDGRPIKVLERPGLWNGSMAHWNTAFVEVPLQTFTPVKTVFDLLRPEHQP